MVYRPFERGALDRYAIIAPLVFGVIAAFIFWRVFANDTYYYGDIVEQERSSETISAETPQGEKEAQKDMQGLLNAWLETLPKDSRVGVSIYDLDSEEIMAEHNAHEIFKTASLYKLFVVYVGYLKVQEGELSLTKKINNKYTVSDCLDLAIRESSSVCAETLEKIIGAKEIQNIMEDKFYLVESELSELTSSPADMMRMLKVYYEHEDLSEEDWEKIQDSMLNQPKKNDSELCNVVCDYRQGLPAGFKTAKVYDKVGWLGGEKGWEIYNDAAIVEFEEIGKHFIVVIFTENLEAGQLARFGEMFEELITK